MATFLFFVSRFAHFDENCPGARNLRQTEARIKMVLLPHLNAYSKQAQLLRFLLGCALVVFSLSSLYGLCGLPGASLLWRKKLNSLEMGKNEGEIAKRTKRATYLLNYLGKTLICFSFFLFTTNSP